MSVAYNAAYLTWTDASGPRSFKFDAVTSEQHVIASELASHPVERGINVTDNVNQQSDEVTIEGIISETPITDILERFQYLALDLPGQSRTALAPKAYPLNYPAPSATGLLSGGPLGVLFKVLSNASRPDHYTGSALVPGTPGQSQASTFQALTAFDAVSDAFQVLRDLKENATLVSIYSPLCAYSNMIVTNVTPSRDPDQGQAATFSVTLQNVRIVSSKIVTAPSASEKRATVETSKGNQPAVAPTGASQSVAHGAVEGALSTWHNLTGF